MISSFLIEPLSPSSYCWCLRFLWTFFVGNHYFVFPYSPIMFYICTHSCTYVHTGIYAHWDCEWQRQRQKDLSVYSSWMNVNQKVHTAGVYTMIWLDLGGISSYENLRIPIKCERKKAFAGTVNTITNSLVIILPFSSKKLSPARKRAARPIIFIFTYQKQNVLWLQITTTMMYNINWISFQKKCQYFIDIDQTAAQQQQLVKVFNLMNYESVLKILFLVNFRWDFFGFALRLSMIDCTHLVLNVFANQANYLLIEKSAHISQLNFIPN